jgi:U3 small nucleolar RNA-associated protein 10
MLSILHIKYVHHIYGGAWSNFLAGRQSSMWAFINPAKTTGKPLPREILVSEMVSNLDVARFVTSLLPSALDASCAHRVLIGFNAAILTAYINATKTFSEGVLAFLLPSLTKPLRVGGNKDCIVRGHPLYE